MTTLAQIRHVAAKDVRHNQWLLLVYVVAVVIATLNALTLHGSTSGPLSIAVLLIVVFGMAMAATFVQSDSPSRSNVFWATRPLDSTAVMITKLALVMIVIVGIAVVGEIVGLSAYNLPARTMAALVMRSIGEYGAWLLPAMIVAAFTADFRSFAMVLLVGTFVFLLAGQLLSDRVGGVHVPLVVAFLGIAVALATLAYSYRRRDPRQPLLLWGLAALGLFSAFTLVISSPRAVTAAPSVAARNAPLELTDSGATVQGGLLVLHLYGEHPDERRSIRFLCDTTIVHLRDGSTVPLVPRFGSVALHNAAIPVTNSISYRVEGRDATFGGVAYQLDDAERSALTRGIASIEIAGRINEYSPTLSASLPLRAGATVTETGTRFGIAGVGYADSLTIELLLSSVLPQESFFVAGNAGGGFFGGGLEGPNFVLVNTGRLEIIPLQNHSTSSSSSWVVLPGAPLQQSSLQLIPVTNPRNHAMVKPDSNWVRNARLVLIDWRSVASYRIHTELPVR